LRSLVFKWPGCDYPLSFSADGRWLGLQVAGRTVRLLEVERAPEHRVLLANAVKECNGAFSPDGRWVVVGGDGLQCWDTRTAQRLWTEPVGYVHDVTFRPDGGVLLTTDETGAREWPWLVDPATGVPRLGEPRPLPVRWPSAQAEYSRGGSVLVISQEEGLWVSDPRAPKPMVLPLPMCTFAVVSPDGRWAAGSAWTRFGMKVWELPSGREVYQLTNANPALAFTRDGRWLVLVWADYYQCLEVGSWRSVAQAFHDRVSFLPLAVSGDSRWMVIEPGPRGRFRFVELPTLRPFLTLDAAGEFPLCFSPDDAFLLTRRSGGQFGLWDLRRIREELTPLGLGW
jgi:WD40 repeat protein